MRRAGYAVVDVDIERGAVPAAWTAGGALVIARRDGVPVGAGLFHRPPERWVELAELLQLRDGVPPGPLAARVSVTVAVCTRDRPVRLLRALDAIRRAASAAVREVDVEVLVVDNGSLDDRSRAAVLARGARYEREPVPGLDVARNRAVRESAGEILVFVDDDVVVDDLWLRTVARAFGAHPEAVAVSGQVLALELETPAQVDFERSTGFSLGWGTMSFSHTDASDLPFRPGIGVGCNMAFRREALLRVGPFDEALDTGRPLPGGGDLDMMIRMVLAGRVVYEPSAVVFHEHRRTWSELRYQYYTWGKGWAAVLDKWDRDPAFRPRARAAARRAMRGIVGDLVRGPHRTGRYRRWHCALFAVGLASGWLGSYERSVRRVERRRQLVAATASGG